MLLFHHLTAHFHSFPQKCHIATVMNSVGYDAVTLDNREFDYGTPRMKELMPRINTDVVCANFYETATGKPVFAPYALKRYGEKTIGFVGATTPDAMSKKYAFFDSDGTQRYDMLRARSRSEM